MSPGDFYALTHCLGISRSGLDAANPTFRQWVFDRLERGVSVDDINREYYEMRGWKYDLTPEEKAYGERKFREWQAVLHASTEEERQKALAQFGSD